MKIGFDFEDHAGGLTPAARGHVVFEPSHKHLHADGGLGTIRPFTIKFNKPFVVDLEATTPDWAWKITVTTGADVFTGYYIIDRDTDFSKLVKVDPTTLEPDAEPEPAWWAMARSTVNGGEVVGGYLWLTRADGTRFNAGRVEGAPGKDGVDGRPGRDGVDGRPGVDGVVNDEVVAKIIGEDGSSKTVISELIEETAVTRGEYFVSVADYGAKGNGVADDTTAWVNAELAAYGRGGDCKLFAPHGTYRISETINIRCALDASQATVRYYGTGTALVIGDESVPGKVTPRRTFNLPRVINMRRASSGWESGSVGVRLTNLDTCMLLVPFVQDFEQGLVLNGASAGVAYNNIVLGALWNNRKNLILTNDATGWANQNNFIGGRLNHTVTHDAFLDDPNANQISMVSDTSFGGPNNNTFTNTSIEGVNLAYYRIDISGKYNQFINCRYENFGTPFRLHYRENAEWNVIQGGYNAAQITEVFDGTRGGGALYGNLGFYARAFNTAGQVIPDNTITSVNSWNTPTLAGVTYDAATGRFKPRPGRWLITATVCFAPNSVGRRIMRLEQDGALLEIAETTPGANRETMKCVAVERFNGLQTFGVSVNQTSGASLALDVSTPYVKITANYLGY